MKLLPPVLPDSYPTLNDLLAAVNEFAGDQGYEIVKKRTKKTKKRMLKKTMLRCDKKRNATPQGFERRDTAIRSTECPFDAVATLTEEG